MELPRTLDPTECKLAIHHINRTNNHQLNAFKNSNSFKLFDDNQKQRPLENKQPPFRITKLNTFHYCAFAWIANSQLVLNATLKTRLSVRATMNLILKNWSLSVKEFEIAYDDKDDKNLIYHGHTLPCLHDDGFCKPNILNSFIIVWFPVELCLVFSIHSFIGRMSKLNNHYWLETEHVLVIKTPIFQLTLLTMIPNLKPASLVSKLYLKIKCFVSNPHIYTLLKTLTYSLPIKTVLTCTLVNVILFNSLKVNITINSLHN